MSTDCGTPSASLLWATSSLNFLSCLYSSSNYTLALSAVSQSFTNIGAISGLYSMSDGRSFVPSNIISEGGAHCGMFSSISHFISPSRMR